MQRQTKIWRHGDHVIRLRHQYHICIRNRHHRSRKMVMGKYARKIRKNNNDYSSVSLAKVIMIGRKRCICNIDQDKFPREAFQANLSAFINSHQKINEQIVLCLDLNENTARTNGPIQQTLMHTNSLTDALKHKHGSDTPATHNRGSHTIDEIFLSDSLLDIENVGWL